MPAPYYLVRVRETGADETAPWRELPPILASGTSLEIDVPDAATEYDLRISYVDQDGDESAVHTIERHAAGGRAGPPPDPDELQVTGGCLRWRSAAGPGVKGYLVRYLSGEHEDPALMLPAHEGLWPAPPFPLCSIPLGIITFAVIAVGPDGIESLRPGVLTVDRGALDDRDAVTHVEIVEEDLGWPGQVVNGEISGGVVQGVVDAAAPYGPILAPLYGDYEYDTLYGDPEDDTGLYGPDTTDRRFYGPDDPAAEYGDDEYGDLVYQVRKRISPREARGRTLTLDAAVVGPSVRMEFRHDATLYGPPVTGAYGAGAADETAELYGPPEAAAWRPWSGRMDQGGGLYEFRLTVPGGAAQPKITSFLVALSAPT